MKYKNTIYYIILAFTTLVGLWVIPSLVKKATYAPDNYPFIYYSSLLKELGVVDRKDKQMPLTDLKGNKYTTAQFDSLMPLLNFRQLMTDGKLPDSIGGYEITPQLLRSKSVVFRYTPEMVQTPHTPLYILFETMPKRVGLEMPDDVFRMNNEIAFIDVETNTVNHSKSEMFQKAVDKAGFQFPPRWLVGNPNPRKAYDEGYFMLDAGGSLFHMKMVNGRPYIRDTHVSDSIDVAHFSILEVSDKRFYGFVFSKAGDAYILESEEGGYKPLKLDMPRIDLTQDQITIMGNLLYWTVWVTTPRARHYYALETQTLKQVAAHTVDRRATAWDKTVSLIFPYYLTLEQSGSDYIAPRFHFTAWCAFGVHALLAVFAFFLFRNRKQGIFAPIYVLFTGLAGFIALWIIPNFK